MKNDGVECSEVGRLAGVPRYSRRAFPPYRYVPGLNVHPTKYPDGHSYGLAEPCCERDGAEALALLAYGVDLLNHRYLWECHEMCEFLWKQWHRECREARILQSIILLAVARLHRCRDKDAVATKVARTGVCRLENIDGVYGGVTVACVRSALESLIAGESHEAVLIISE